MMKLPIKLVFFISTIESSFCSKYTHLDALDSLVQFLKGQIKMAEMATDLECVNAKYPHGSGGYVIHGCVAIGSTECLKNVLKNGADIHLKDDRKKTALDYAKMGASEPEDAYSKVFQIDYRGVFEILERIESLNTTDYVVAKGCHLNDTEWEKIMRESFKEYFDEAIKGGIDRQVVFPVHIGGGSFLHNCVSSNFYTCVKVMLENRVDINIKDDAGKTALDLALENGFVQVAELIIATNKVISTTVTSPSIESASLTKLTNLDVTTVLTILNESSRFEASEVSNSNNSVEDTASNL